VLFIPFVAKVKTPSELLLKLAKPKVAPILKLPLLVLERMVAVPLKLAFKFAVAPFDTSKAVFTLVTVLAPEIVNVPALTLMVGIVEMGDAAVKLVVPSVTPNESCPICRSDALIAPLNVLLTPEIYKSPVIEPPLFVIDEFA